MIIDLNYRVDILKGIVSQNAEHPLYYDDQNAHRVNVSLYRGQEEIDLSGLSCNGYVVFVKEGASIGPLTGEVSNNTCSVVLPHEAYQHPGAIRVEIKLIEGDSVTTVLMLMGHVSSGRGDHIIDITGSIVPSLDSLKATIEELESRIAAIEVSKIVWKDEMSPEFLCRMLFGNEDDWSVENYSSAAYSATKTGRIITYKGNNTSNSGFQSVNLTGVPGAPHTARSGNFSNIALADTDFVPIPAILKSISQQSAAYPVMLFLSAYMHYDRYNDDGHAGFSFDYVLRRYNTETETYEYTQRTTTSLGLINTATTADGVDRISIAQLIPDGRGGDYVVNWDEWEEMAIFAMRRNRMFSGTMLLAPSLEIYGDQKPVVYSAEQTLEFGEQRQARMNIDALPRAAMESANVIAGKHPRLALETRNGVTNSVTSIGNGETLTLNGTSSSGFVISLLGNYPLGTGSSTVPGAASLAQGPFDVAPGHTYLMRFRLVSGSYTGNNPRIALYDTTGAEISGMSCDIPTGEKTFVMDDRTQIGQYGAFFYKNTTYNNATFAMEWVDITDGAGNLEARIEANTKDIYMEPWQLVAKKYFLPDSTGNLTVRRNHITYRPSGSTSAGNVRSLIGAYEGSSTTLGNYRPTIDQLIPVSVFGDAIKIGFYLDAAGTTRYPRFAYKFCTVDGETVTPISNAYGTVPATAATGVLAETTAAVPDGATHVFFGLLYSNGYEESATYDMVYKVDKG